LGISYSAAGNMYIKRYETRTRTRAGEKEKEKKKARVRGTRSISFFACMKNEVAKPVHS